MRPRSSAWALRAATSASAAAALIASVRESAEKDARRQRQLQAVADRLGAEVLGFVDEVAQLSAQGEAAREEKTDAGREHARRAVQYGRARLGAGEEEAFGAHQATAQAQHHVEV